MGSLVELGGKSNDYEGIIGKKAFQLHQMINQGFNVPSCVCIPTSEYESHIQENNLTQLVKQANDTRLRDDLAKLREKIMEISFSQEIKDEITKYMEKLPNGTSFVVRSSALMEDLDNVSFAGQYDTFLGLKKIGDVLEAVKKCWASTWLDNIFSYTEFTNLPVEIPKMAVIIQVQIEAVVSGVLFTLNPLSGREEEMMIESIFGLGEGAVSGQITPDRYIANWKTGKILKMQINPKKYKITTNTEGGIKKIELPDDVSDSPTLDTSKVNKIVRLGIEVAKYYGKPQDIEWGIENGKLYLLQTRPITSYQFDPEIGQWTNANFVEVFPGMHNPLSFSLTGEAFTSTLQEFFINTKIWRDPPPEEERPIWHKYFFGRCYWNVSAVKKILLQIPGFNERTFDTTTGVEIQYTDDGRTTGWSVGRIIWGIPVLLSLEKEYRTFHKKVLEYIESYFTYEEYLKSQTKKLKTLPNDEFETYIAELFNKHLEANYYAQYVSFLAAQSQDDFHAFLNKINKSLPDPKQINPANLFTGQSDVKTAQPLLELYEIAGQIYSNNDIKDTVLNISNNEFNEILREGGRFNEINGLLRDYIDKYFWMTSTDEDLSMKRWIDDPSFVVILLKQLLKSGHIPTNTELIQKEVRLQEEVHANQVLKEGFGKYRILRNRSFWKQVENVRKHTYYREESRYMLSRLYYYIHRALMELSNRWVNEGILSKNLDLFSLKYTQILDFFSDRNITDLRSAIDDYSIIYQMFRKFKPPGTIGANIKISKSKSQTDDTYQGIPCSSGIVKGRARVINSLDQIDEIETGEILIVPYTNPGWTPIFSIIRGIIMEEGGLLSHGAVIARECGIPAVLQIEDATSLIRTGDIVELNGTTGSVKIIKN